MIFALQDWMRLSVAMMLALIWAVRRVDEENLHWTCAYTAISVASVACTWPNHNLTRMAVFIGAGVLGAVFMWSGATIFSRKGLKRKTIALVLVAGWVVFAALGYFARPYLMPALSAAICITTCYAGAVVGSHFRYYFTAGVATIAPALILFVHDVWFGQSQFVADLLAWSYGLLGLAIAHVTAKRYHLVQQRFANTDPLTGLASRTSFIHQLKGLLQATFADPVYIAVLCIDIENFRSVNEAIGYRNGSSVLAEVASRFRHAAQRVYVVARDEGDRFMLMLSGTSDASVMRGVEEVAKQLVSALQAPVRIADADLMLRIRIGADVAWGPKANVELMLEHAAIASGRQGNELAFGVQFYNEKMNQAAIRTLALERGMREALAQDGLSIAYQPIVDLDSGVTVMLEALLRWTSPELGVVHPAEMVPIAEQSGLIAEIGDWVLDQVTDQIVLWQGQGMHLPVSINVSSHQLRHALFCTGLLNMLKAKKIGAQMIEVELTESAFIGEDQVILANLHALRDAGVGLSLDDFGTGFSSLAYLTRLPLTTIKIDKTFVHQLERDGRSRKLTETICAIGNSLDLKLIAEGVETAEQARQLRAFGVMRVQGFYFAKPMGAVQITHMLGQNSKSSAAA